MCLFFATNMASKYEHQKTQTEIHSNKVKELEEKLHELSTINQELTQIRQTLVQEKEQLLKEINLLREKHPEPEDWKLTTKKEPALATPSDNKMPIQELEEAQQTSTPE